MIVCKVRNRELRVMPMSPVTTGSRGLPVSWHFDEDWDDLEKIAVFSVVSGGEVIQTAQDMAIQGDVCTVPEELLAQTYAGKQLRIGVYGDDGSTVAIPTIYAHLLIQDGAEPENIQPGEGTPTWAAQVQGAANEALTKASAVEAAAARGDFDGVSPEVTISQITHGHSVTITDRDHPQGQPFNVLDGATAYEQAAAGGYTGTEAQFNQELANFKTWSESASGSASGAEDAQEAAEIAQGKAEDAQEAAETAQGKAEDAQEAAETAQGKAEDAQEAAETAQTGAETAEDNAEAWAKGTKNGEPVGSSDPAYHNNAKYYSEQASALANVEALKAEGFAIGEQNGTPVESGSPYYQNNSEYFKDQAAASATDAAASEAHAAALVESLPDDYQELLEDVGVLNATYAAETVSGSIATFDAPSAGLPLKKLVVNIEPVQAGSGDPSPQNVRAISGWTGASIYREAVYDSSANPIVEIPFPTPPGTVYGGTLTINDDGTGELIVDKNFISLDGNVEWSELNSPIGSGKFYANAIPANSAKESADYISNLYLFAGKGATKSSDVTIDKRFYGQRSYGRFWVYDSDYLNNLDGFKSALNTTPLQIVYPLNNSLSYTLTAAQITTLLGTNNVWADCGDVSVDVGAYLPATNGRIDGVKNDLLNLLSCIAPIENGATASQAYAQGAYFFYAGDFCKAKTAIASGATFTLNTNYEVTTVAAALMALT